MVTDTIGTDTIGTATIVLVVFVATLGCVTLVLGEMRSRRIRQDIGQIRALRQNQVARLVELAPSGTVALADGQRQDYLALASDLRKQIKFQKWLIRALWAQGLFSPDLTNSLIWQRHCLTCCEGALS